MKGLFLAVMLTVGGMVAATPAQAQCANGSCRVSSSYTSGQPARNVVRYVAQERPVRTVVYGVIQRQPVRTTVRRVFSWRPFSRIRSCRSCR